MPYSIRFEPDHRIFVATGSGALTMEEARQGAVSVWNHPEWNGNPVVWDFREAQIELTSENVREIARFIHENQPPRPPSKIALVTGRTVDYGMARMFGAYREDTSTEVRIFRDYDEAAAWAQGE